MMIWTSGFPESDRNWVIVYAVMMIKIGSIIIFQLSSHIKNPKNFRPPIGGQYYIVLQYNIWPDPPTHPRKLRNFGMLPKGSGTSEDVFI